jgi:hypothetical protein
MATPIIALSQKKMEKEAGAFKSKPRAGTRPVRPTL